MGGQAWLPRAGTPARLKDTPDCLHCGACCFSRGAAFVPVDGRDWERLGGDADRLALFIGNRAFMRMRDGHCAALIVKPLTGEFICSVYERRPQVCRDLARGSPACEAERELKGASTGVALRISGVESGREA